MRLLLWLLIEVIGMERWTPTDTLFWKRALSSVGSGYWLPGSDSCPDQGHAYGRAPIRAQNGDQSPGEGNITWHDHLTRTTGKHALIAEKLTQTWFPGFFFWWRGRCRKPVQWRQSHKSSRGRWARALCCQALGWTRGSSQTHLVRYR